MSKKNSETVKVMVRSRPMNRREKEGCKEGFLMNDRIYLSREGGQVAELD